MSLARISESGRNLIASFLRVLFGTHYDLQPGCISRFVQRNSMEATVSHAGCPRMGCSVSGPGAQQLKGDD